MNFRKILTMHENSRRILCHLSFLFAFAFTPPLFSQDTFDLRPRWTQGLVIDQEVRLTIDLEEHYGMPEMKDQAYSSKTKTILVDHMKDTCLQVGTNGLPEKIRRTYGESVEEIEADGQKYRSESPLSGKSLTFSRDGKVVGGKSLPPELLKSLEKFDDSKSQFMPDRPVAVGHEWSLNVRPAFLGGYLDLTDPGSVDDTLVLNLTFEEVVEYKTRRCARIRLAWLHKAHLEKPVGRFYLEYFGNLYFDLSVRQLIGVDLEGDIKISRELPGEDANSPIQHVRSEGKLVLSMTFKLGS